MGKISTSFIFQAKPIEPTVAAGAQVQQLINFVCVQEFNRVPILKLSFTHTYAGLILVPLDRGEYEYKKKKVIVFLF